MKITQITGVYNNNNSNSVKRCWSFELWFMLFEWIINDWCHYGDIVSKQTLVILVIYPMHPLVIYSTPYPQLCQLLRNQHAWHIAVCAPDCHLFHHPLVITPPLSYNPTPYPPLPMCNWEHDKYPQFGSAFKQEGVQGLGTRDMFHVLSRWTR